MTKQEAIEAMKAGKKVTHVYFTDEEWITMEGNVIIDENGYHFDPDLFWFDRKSEAFNTGWSEFKKSEV